MELVVTKLLAYEAKAQCTCGRILFYIQGDALSKKDGTYFYPLWCLKCLETGEMRMLDKPSKNFVGQHQVIFRHPSQLKKKN